MRDEELFLGRGWSFPPAFGDAGAEVHTVQGADDVHESLQILFATTLGERVMRPDFGCDLSSVVFEEIDQGLINRLSAMIRDGVLNHEPRIELQQLNVSESAQEPGLLNISLVYSIRGTNSRYNMVYPFYVKEAAAPGS